MNKIKYLAFGFILIIAFGFILSEAEEARAIPLAPNDCSMIQWTPDYFSVPWKKIADQTKTQNFTATHTYCEGLQTPGCEQSVSLNCTAPGVNGATCDVQVKEIQPGQRDQEGNYYCLYNSQWLNATSPDNKVDLDRPVCGSWSGPSQAYEYTLTGSTDATSGIATGSGSCTPNPGQSCSVTISDVAGNTNTCTSPVRPAQYSCYGSIPTNAGLCSGDDSGLAASTPNTLVPACTAPNKCEFTCDAGYQYQNVFGFASCVPIPSQSPLSCSPASQSIGVGLGARVGASGGDGNYNWGISGSNCFGGPETGNPSVFWGGCNTPGAASVVVSDNSGHQASCGLVVTSGQPLTCSPATQTVAELQGASFSATGGVGTLRWSTSGSPFGSPMAGTGSTFLTSYGKCGEKIITVTDDLGASASCGLTVTGTSCQPGPVCNYNGVQDNGETGVDCGGGGCVACSVPPGACARYWETNPHYVCEDYACMRVDACGSNLDGCTAAKVGLECGQPSGAGDITVSSNSSSATWLLDGPQGAYLGSGTYQSYSSFAAPGTYSVISTKSGCEVNSPVSQTLFPGQTISFNITCGAPPTCFISAVPSSQTTSIGSNASFMATTTCSDGSTPPDNINLTDWAVNKSASFVSGENNSKTTTLKCDSSTGGVPALVTPSLGSLIPISSNLTCNPVLSCSPINQVVDINQNANFSASGGSNYSWTATGGSPASGSSASFATKYTTVGNKTVTVSSDGNNASCSVNVIQPKHNECVMVNGAPACSLIDGRAPDRCNTVADCGGGSCNYNGSQDNGETGVDCGGGGCPSCGGNPPLKYSCGSGSCQVDSAGPYTDSTCGGVCSPTYYSCSNGSCSADANGQFTSADCNNMCVAPIHSECNGPACVNVFGPGNNSCTVDNPDCGVATTITHLGCIGNACVILNGVGSNECGAVGEACVTGGGGKCSLKAAPPLVSGGQSVKLTWQCTGSPTCSITRKYNNSNTTVTVQDPAVRTSGNFSDKPLSSGVYTLKCDIPAADATASVKVSTLIECAPTDPTCKP